MPRPETWLGHLETSYAQHWFSNRGPLVQELEGALAARAPNGREASVTCSATAGLVATLLALDLRGPIAVPAFTFPASAHAIELAGCLPVLCDVDADTWELDPDAAAEAVRAHGCVAIMHVRAFGLCRDLHAIEAVAAHAGVPLVIDSAAAYGGADATGTPPGGAGTAEVFSFHATKVFAAGEGGVVVAPPELAERVRRTLNFSLSDGDVAARGMNGKLSELTAAVALAMLDQLDRHVAVRHAAVASLLAAARSSPLQFDEPADPGFPPWQGLPLRLHEPEARDHVIAGLHAAGVEARPYYAPGLQQTRAFAGCPADALSVTRALAERVLCLPVYSHYEPGELDELADAVHETFSVAHASDRGLSRR